jgi:hypothetical protein
MARIRSVHPDLCVDETLAGVSAGAERTFVRLWPHLDDDGRARDDARLLKAALYPLHDEITSVHVDADLDELAQAGLVLRYVVDGKRFLSAKPETWKRYQKPRHRYESNFPSPDDPSATHVGPTSDAGATDVGMSSTERPADPRPTDVGPAPAGGERRGEDDGGAATSADVTPTPRGPQARQQRLEEAIDLLVDAHMERYPSKGPASVHRRGVRDGKLKDHHQTGHRFLCETPEMTAAELAWLLEPTTMSGTAGQSQPAEPPRPRLRSVAEIRAEDPEVTAPPPANLRAGLGRGSDG